MEALAAPVSISARPTVSGDTGFADAIEKARSGDVAAFEILYRQTVGRIHGLCLRMCGDVHLAEELTQESYIRAWKKLHTFRGDSLFTTWLHRVAVNVVLGHLRTSNRRPELDGVEDESVDFPVVERLDPQITIDLERAISGLPPRARTVFVLHDVEGYTHKEVAGMADMAVGTSKAQLSRARRLLRKVLAS